MEHLSYSSAARRAGYLGSVALLATIPSLAVAQTTGSGQPPSTSTQSQPPAQAEAVTTAAAGDIIVTAQKRSERLQDVPMSITAATGAQLKTQGVTNLEELTRIAPGFTTSKTQYGLPVFYIRGIGFNDTAIGASPAVSSYTDQLPIPYAPMARGATLDLERVEILKGPQGTLFGQNSTGGAINFIAAKPTRELHAGYDLTYGRFNEVDAEAFISGPISDTMSARLAVRNEYRGDWQRGYTNNETLGQKDFQNARFLLDWQPVDRIKVELLATGWKDRSDAQQPQLALFDPEVTGPFARPIPFPVGSFPSAPKNDRDAAWDPGKDLRQNNWFYQFGAHVDVELSDAVTLSSLTSYAKFSQHVPTDFDGTVYPISLNTQEGRIRSFSQELRLSGSFAADRAKWMVGGNYQNDNVFEHLITNPILVTTLPIVDGFYTNNDQKVDTKSVFGSLDYKLTSTLTIQGSARYTDQKRDFRGCFFDNGDGTAAALFSLLFGRPFTPGTCLTPDAAGNSVPFISGKLDEHNVSWRGGITWQPSREILFYANVTKGYKSGSFPTIPYTTAENSAPVKQESVLAYEVGSKVSLFDRALQLDSAAFYYDYRDKQLNGYINIPGVGVAPTLVSIPKSAVYGAEISATLRPFTALTLTANGTYVHTRIDRNPVDRDTGATLAPSDYLGNPSSYIGLSFPNTPKWQGTFDAEYRMPVSSTLKAYVGSTVTYNSANYGILPSGDAALDALVKRPKYALLDVRAGVETDNGRWRAELWGRNITNKYYLIGTVRATDYFTRFTGMPATYGISVYFRY